MISDMDICGSEMNSVGLAGVVWLYLGLLGVALWRADAERGCVAEVGTGTSGMAMMILVGTGRRLQICGAREC